MAEVNIHHAIDVGISQGNRVSVESPADHEVAVPVADLAVMLHFTDEGPRTVLDGPQLFRKGAAAGAVARSRGLQLQRLVGAYQIVKGPPVVEAMLAMIQIPEGLTDQHFVLQGSMKALVLTQCLGMVWTAVAHRDAQADQPGRKARVERALMAPGWSVVHDHGLGQSVTPEDLAESRLHRFGLLVSAGLQA